MLVFFVFVELMCVAGGDVFLGDEVSFVQIGDGTTTQRNTPVGVVGLSSGIVMVALGWVRFSFLIAVCLMFSCGSDCCVFG